MLVRILYEVIAEENNHGRHAILSTPYYNEARQLEKEINAGFYAGCLLLAEIKTKHVYA